MTTYEVSEVLTRGWTVPEGTVFPKTVWDLKEAWQVNECQWNTRVFYLGLPGEFQGCRSLAEAKPTIEIPVPGVEWKPAGGMEPWHPASSVPEPLGALMIAVGITLLWLGRRMVR